MQENVFDLTEENIIKAINEIDEKYEYYFKKCI